MLEIEKPSKVVVLDEKDPKNYHYIYILTKIGKEEEVKEEENKEDEKKEEKKEEKNNIFLDVICLKLIFFIFFLFVFLKIHILYPHF